MSARLSDYDYALPRELIAQRPLERRQDSRMMVLHRAEHKIEHRQFGDLKTFLRPGDLLVLNDTRVLAARRFSDDGAVEFLFLERLGPTRWKCMVNPGRKMRVSTSVTIEGVCLRVEEVTPEGERIGPTRWKCMVTPGRKMQVGATATIDDVCLRVEKITADGERIVAFDQDVDVYTGGSMPLPPYVNRPSDEADAARYQTVFAREPGAVAAPTAGLHFTSEILSEIPHTFVTLHVGPGTFLPVRAENKSEHRMHAERFFIWPQAADKINNAQGIVAVGTTAMRVLETATRNNKLPSRQVEPQSGETDVFIYPPFTFRVVDALLTNFHLPRSTLLMLVSAFAGREFILRAYEEAIHERYRFYSYGDCMLIL